MERRSVEERGGGRGWHPHTGKMWNIDQTPLETKLM